MPDNVIPSVAFGLLPDWVAMGSESASFDDPAKQLAAFLRPGEQLQWSGRPDPDVRFAPSDAFMVPFSVMWGGFALFWEGSVLSSGGPPVFAAFGVPFVGIGLYFVFGRFIFKKRTKLKTAYGIAGDRAIVVTGSSTMADSPIRQVPTSIRRSPDGRHVTVTFGNVVPRPGSAMYANTGMDFFNRGAAPLGFYDVADPDRLLAALERARS